jgi:hypothetical protein
MNRPRTFRNVVSASCHHSENARVCSISIESLVGCMPYSLYSISCSNAPELIHHDERAYPADAYPGFGVFRQLV